MQVSEDRSWAKDLSELEFHQEYVKRTQRSDIVPTKAKYLKFKPQKKDVFFMPYEDTSLKSKETFKYVCSCGEGFNKPLDKARHVRKCETDGKN